MNSQEVKELINKHPGRFYVYVLRRPNGDPFYVGKAAWNNRLRIFCHEVEARNCYDHRYYRNNVIKMIWDGGGQVDYGIALFTRDEGLAFKKEIELIKLYGRKSNGTGILANLSNGGEGGGNGGANQGQKRSLESKLKMSISHKGKPGLRKGRKLTKEQRKRLSEAHKGYKHSEEQKRKIAEANRKTKGTKAYKEKVSALTKGEKNPMYGRRGKDAPMHGRYGDRHPMYGKSHTEEVRKRIGEASRLRWANQDYRKRVLAARGIEG